MRKHIKKFLSLFTAGAMSLSALPFISAQAQDVSSMTPKQIAADMGVGWNLGNTLDAHDGTNHKKMGLESETYWGNPKATKELIDAVKAKGFNTIRIPVTWYPHADANYKIDSAWMSRVKQVVDWAIADDTYVILNVHHDEWNRPTNANYSAASKELKAFWKQIATEFQNYDRHLIFEGMNEPRNYGGTHEWDGGTTEMREVVNKLDKDFVDTVRATGGKNKTRCLMIPTYAASSTTAAMRALTIPDDPNVMVSIHAYTPYNFTMKTTGSGATSVFDSNMENELKQLFNDINNIYLSKGKAVVIGEFSSSNKNNTSERVKWANSYATLAKNKGIPIVLWDNNAPVDKYNNGEGHGYINRKTLQWYDTAEPVVNALIKSYGHVKASKEKTISNCKITLSQKYFTYDGNEHKPAVTVTFSGTKLTEGKEYSLTYKGGRNVGEASVTVTGIGNFKGSSTVKYAIDPSNLSGYKLGDVNFDNSITITDLTLAAAHAKGKNILSASRIKAADINRDGKVNTTDITRIAAHVKLKKRLPNESVA